MTTLFPGLFPWGTVQAAAPKPAEVTPLSSKPANAEPPGKPQTSRKAVVFVHGIFSSHATFDTARDQMIRNPALKGVELHYFDYLFHEPMDENGRRLAKALRVCFAEGDSVALVAHSMGGLVARFAILSERLEFVRILFLLGTPNAGALRLSQLTALMQLLHGATNRFFTLFPRHSGVPTLSKAAELIEAQRGSFRNAIGIDYVSVPGRFFHEERSRWQVPRRAQDIPFALLEAALLRVVAIRLTRPHDGIVEESSNHLTKCRRSTEKSDSYGGPRGSRPATYGHLTMAACVELNHVEIHADPVVIDMTSRIITMEILDSGTSRRTLEDWFTNLSPEDRLSYDVQLSFDR